MIFQPIATTSIDWKSFLQIATKNNLPVGDTLDKNGMTTDNPLSYLLSIAALQFDKRIIPSQVFTHPRSLGRHLHFGFFFILHVDLATKLATNANLAVTSYEYSAVENVGIVSGTLQQWFDAVLEAHTIYSEDKQYLMLFNGIYKIFDVIGMSKLFSDYEQISTTDKLFRLRMKS
jgi:hypothetical protein